jgi:hypothetical protein
MNLHNYLDIINLPKCQEKILTDLIYDIDYILVNNSHTKEKLSFLRL